MTNIGLTITFFIYILAGLTELAMWVFAYWKTRQIQTYGIPLKGTVIDYKRSGLLRRSRKRYYNAVVNFYFEGKMLTVKSIQTFPKRDAPIISSVHEIQYCESFPDRVLILDIEKFNWWHRFISLISLSVLFYMLSPIHSTTLTDQSAFFWIMINAFPIAWITNAIWENFK